MIGANFLRILIEMSYFSKPLSKLLHFYFWWVSFENANFIYLTNQNTMQSSATSVQEYLETLPPDRKEAIQEVREVILRNLPKGIEETMNWGMISYEVPLEVYPDTYNKKPLLFAALASQKNHMAVYLSAIYCNEGLRDNFENEYRASGKKMDMGKSCVRFKKLDNLPLDVIGRAIGAVDMETFILFVEEGRRK